MFSNFCHVLNSDFIETRTNEAYEAFTKYRLEGRSVDVAQELVPCVFFSTATMYLAGM